MTPTNGNGLAASIQDQGPMKSSPAHQARSKMPARNLRARGRSFFANRTEADFQAWRYQRNSTAWKYAMWDGGFKLPTQLPTRRSKCFCGADLTISGVTDHVRSADVHMGMA
jgi:hypothetical protein